MKGSELSRLLRKHKLTQGVLARHLNIAPSTVTNWKNGKHQMSESVDQTIRGFFKLVEEGSFVQEKPVKAVAEETATLAKISRDIDVLQACIDRKLEESNRDSVDYKRIRFIIREEIGRALAEFVPVSTPQPKPHDPLEPYRPTDPEMVEIRENARRVSRGEYRY